MLGSAWGPPYWGAAATTHAFDRSRVLFEAEPPSFVAVGV
jgi:hypothetical protein